MRTPGEEVMSYKVKKTMKTTSGKQKFKMWVEEHNITQNEKAQNHRSMKAVI